MRRNTSSGNDSLELLLDTICNVFGGVVFIAILIALLTSAKTHSVRTQQQGDPTAIRAAISNQELDAEIETIREALRQLEGTRTALDTSQARQTIEAMGKTREAVKEADQRIAVLEAWVEQFRQLDDENAQKAKHRRDQAVEQVQSLRQALDQASAQSTIEGRLPQSRTTAKNQVLFLLGRDKVYWIPVGQMANLLVELRADDVHVKKAPLSLTVTVNPKEGFTIPPAEDPGPDLRAVIEAMDPRQHFFDLYVSPDSVEAFRRMKRAITGAGFDYNVTPTEHAQHLVLSYTDSLETQ